MANYSLVIGSKYSPFTFDELLKPALMATQAHRELEDQYSELATKANVWEEIANKETDPYAYQMYKKYSDDLKAQADILATQGLTPGSRKAMLSMRNRYSKEITPIELAYSRRRELTNEQREALLKDNTMMYDIDASTLSIDDLIKNPELSYRGYSGAVLANQVGTAAKALAKDMQENPRKWRDILDGQYYETMMRKGYTPEQVLLASIDDPNAPKELTNIVEQAIESSGIRNWGDENSLRKAYEYARQGLWESVGDTTYQIQNNKAYDYAMSEAAQIRKEARERAAAQQQALNTNLLAINPSNIHSSREQEKAAQNIKDYSKYFTKDANGNTILTEEGMKEYRKELSEVIPSGGPTIGGTQQYDIINQSRTGISPNNYGKTSFRQFLDSIGVDESNTVIDNWNPRVIGEKWDKYLKDNDTALYDASKVTEYNSIIDSEDRKAAKDAILQSMRGIGKLKEVDYDNESKTFKPTGESITEEELNSNKYEVVATNMSAYGSTVMIKDDKGKVRRFEMLPINPYMESFRDKQLSIVANIQEMLLNGDLTEEEAIALTTEYRIALNAARLYDSQLFLTNKTKPQEFTPYAF